MRRLSIGLIVGLVFISSFLLFSWAGDNPMFDFYNGLAEVIERNMNNPGACLAQAEDYIKNNIKTLQEVAERGRRMAQQNMQKYENMNREELESTMKEAERTMSDPKVAESMNRSMTAMNKFVEVMGEFTVQHPDEGERIMETLSKYSPQENIYQ